MTKIYSPKEKGKANSLKKLVGLDEQKEIIEVFCDFVWSSKWAKYSTTLHFMPTILLYGPPGTGKTSLVRSMVCNFDDDVKYYRESLDLLVDKDLGETSKAIKALFDELIEQSRCGKKVFLQLDDIDSVLSSRYMSNESSGVRRGVNTFLIQLDELLDVKLDCPPIISATTNMYANLDSAIKRRFSLKKEINPILSKSEIEELIKPMINIITNDTNIDYQLIEKEVSNKQLTPHDIILVMQKIFLSTRKQCKFSLGLLLSELKNCESSRVSFEKQELAYSVLK